MRLLALAVVISSSVLAPRLLDAELPERGDIMALEFPDGRRVIGAFAGVENGERLWLIHRETGIELRSGYQLNRIQRVLVKGQPVSLTSLEREQAASSPAWRIPPQEIPLTDHPILIPAPLCKAISLDVLAEPANWDADSEVDGLRLFLTPRDALGQMVPVRGSLSAVLESRRLLPGPLPQRSERAPKVELERWEQWLRPEDFGPEGIIVELPFDGRPPHDLRGLGVPFTLRVRLGIPGQTVLEAVTPVPLGLALP